MAILTGQRRKGVVSSRKAMVSVTRVEEQPWLDEAVDPIDALVDLNTEVMAMLRGWTKFQKT